MPQVALVIGAVASVAGTVASVVQQRKASRLQRQQQTLQTRQSRRQAIRNFQIQRASALVSAEGAGVAGGSGAFGGIGGLTTQFGQAAGYASEMSGLSREITQVNNRAQTAGAVASLGSQAYSWGSARGATFKGSFTPNATPKGSYPNYNHMGYQYS